MILSTLYRLIRFAIGMLLPKDDAKRVWSIDEVKEVLAAKAKETPRRLNWETSIEDLCRLLGFDPTFEARREMFQKAGGAGTYTGSAAQNIWLHGQVMEHLAQQGFVE